MIEKAEENKRIKKGIRLDEDFIKRFKKGILSTWPDAHFKVTVDSGNATFAFENIEEFLEKSEELQYNIDCLKIDITKDDDDVYWSKDKVELCFCSNSEDILDAAIQKKIVMQTVSEYVLIDKTINDALATNELKYSFFSNRILGIYITALIVTLFTWLWLTTLNRYRWEMSMVYVTLFNILLICTRSKFARQIKWTLFPKNEIYFGINRRSIDQGASWRNIIFVVILIGVAVSVLGNIVTRVIT